MTDYTDKFSDGRVPAADSSYAELDLTGTTQACWPHMYNGTQPAISDTTVITCAAAAILRLPPTHQVSTGASLLLRNKGSNTLSVQDSNGVSLFSVPAGIAEYVCVAESVAPGAWEHVTFGAGVASVSAGDLAGYGTRAIGNTLASAAPTLSTASSIPLTAAHRGSSIEFTSGVSSLTLSPAVGYTGDFYCFVKNSGAGLVTISATGGELIDGQSTLGLQPNESLILLCNGVNRWYTVGYGRSTIYQFSQLVLDVSAAGTTTLNSAQASNKLITLVGNPSSAVTVVVPNIVSVYYVANNLSTNQAVQVKTAAVVGTNIAQTQRAVLLCDGTSVSSAQSASVSTVVSMLDGSAAAPALNFSSKTNTGVYKHSTQGIGLTVNGIAQLTSNGAGVDFPAGFGNTAGNVSTSGTLTHSGDILLSGSGKRITGDFSNATEANRVSFQSTTVNGKTIIPLYPNGSGSEAGFATPTVPMVFDVLGTRNLNLAAGGNASLPGTLAMGSAFGFRNYLINVGCQIIQRPATTLLNASLQYGQVDRYVCNIGATTVTSGILLQVTGASTVTGKAVGMYQVSTTGTSSGGFIQRIEANNAVKLNGRTVTFSGTVYQDTGAPIQIGVSLSRATALDNFGATSAIGATASTVVPSGIWTKVAGTFTLGASDGANGIAVSVFWSGLSALTNKSFYTGDWQLEEGSIATPFEHRPYGLELALCQRYFQVKTLGQGVAAVGQAISATAIQGITVPMFGAMRVTPTLVLPPFSITNGISAIANNGAYAGQTAAAHTAIWMDGHISISGGGYSGLVAGNAVGLFSTGAGNQITANAEL